MEFQSFESLLCSPDAIHQLAFRIFDLSNRGKVSFGEGIQANSRQTYSQRQSDRPVVIDKYIWCLYIKHNRCFTQYCIHFSTSLLPFILPPFLPPSIPPFLPPLLPTPEDFKRVLSVTTLHSALPFDFNTSFIRRYFGQDRKHQLEYYEFVQLLQVLTLASCSVLPWHLFRSSLALTNHPCSSSVCTLTSLSCGCFYSQALLTLTSFQSLRSSFCVAFVLQATKIGAKRLGTKLSPHGWLGFEPPNHPLFFNTLEATHAPP